MKIFKHYLLKYLSSLIILVLITSVKSENLDNRGTSSANFLKIGIGGRAVAMGGAFAAISDDATAMFWNPAGVAIIKRPQTVFSYNSWIAGIKMGFIGLVIPLENIGTFGISAIYLYSGEIEETTLIEPTGTGKTFTASDIAIGITYSRYLTDRFCVGGNIKLIQEQLSHETAHAFAVDIGTIFRTDILNGMKIGFVLTNFGSDLQFDGRDLNTTVKIGKNVEARFKTSEWSLPLNFRIGLATDLFKTGIQRATISLGVDDPRDYDPIQRIGIEYGLKNMLFLRSGYIKSSTEEVLTLGCGLNINVPTLGMLTIDYSSSNRKWFGVINQYSLFLEF